jgi:hypothetical protein
MAKSPALPGDNVLSPYPNGIPPKLMEHKMEKTEGAVNARETQVMRREREQ